MSSSSSAALRQRRNRSELPPLESHGAQAEDDAQPKRSPVGDSPRLFSANAFRAAQGSDAENMLLFREQPRQVAVLALVVSVVAYYSFTHESEVSGPAERSD